MYVFFTIIIAYFDVFDTCGCKIFADDLVDEEIGKNETKSKEDGRIATNKADLGFIKNRTEVPSY